MKLTPRLYTPEEKKKYFWRGFAVWWGINIPLAAVELMIAGYFNPYFSSVQRQDTSSNAELVACLPYLVNIGLLVILARTRSEMVLGALAAFGSALALAILFGIIYTVACFVRLAGGS